MHLDTHSWYSFHLGVSAPDELVAHAAELGHRALGLCDIDGTYGLLPFYKAAVKCGINPVLGIALTVGTGFTPSAKSAQALPVAAALTRGHPSRDNQDRADAMNGVPTGNTEKQNAGSLRLTDKSWQAGDARHGVGGIPQQPDAVVLARNRDGYTQLCLLAAGRQLDPQWNLARALAQAGESCYIITDREELLRYLVPRLGPERVFARLIADYGPAYRSAQIQQRKLAERFRIHPCASTDVCFVRPQDRDVHHLLRAIGQNTSFHLAENVRARNHYLAAPTELGGLFYNHPEALATAQSLAERCDVELILGQWHFPDFPFPGKTTPQAALRDLAQRGLASRFKGQHGPEHLARLEMELAVIDKLGYTSYFLFVRDIVREAGQRGIPCLGRGSAANSLVSYLLGLTPIDPLKYGMYFERFLNPDRTSPPDIDIDFNWRRRDEILQYVYDRWGQERVALISTHVTYRSRSALRETAKVFGLSDREISQLSRLMPGMNAQRLAGDLRKLPEMAGLDLNVEPYKHVLPLAARLAGKPRHLGIHCGGIVIAPRTVTEFTGLQRAAKGFVVTQYEMHNAEAIGLIKIDLLGNRSLGVLEDTLAGLKAQGVDPPVFNLRPLTTDPAIASMLREGRTMGCFYIESPAMRALLQRLKTDTYRGLTAASSVIRPGVAESGMMQEYIRRTHGMPPQLPTHPLMDQLLPETHGVMVFQEDVIKVAHEVAGFSPAQADILRRSMSGKMRSQDAMNQLRESFLAGCERNKVDHASALEIWRQLSSFSGYSFCKAHSASFATLSYQVAWLKAHHPAEFLAAVLSNGGGFYGAQAYLSECRRLGLAVLPPDVNASEYGYTAEGPEFRVQGSRFRVQGGESAAGAPESGRRRAAATTHNSLEPSPLNLESESGVRLGLSVIKNVTSELLQRIPVERARRGRFDGLREFIQRVRPHRSELEVLIMCGALDSLGRTRPELLWEAGLAAVGTGLAPSAKRHSATALAGAHTRAQVSLILPLRADAMNGVPTEDLSDYSRERELELEQEHFGMVVSCHPLEAYPGLPTQGIVRAVDLERHAGRRVRLLGWCIATKRVGVAVRSKGQDTLSLRAEETDLPDDPGAGEDDDAPEGAAVDIGLVARGSGPVRDVEYHARATNAMKFMSMEDTTGTYEVTLFPQAYARFAPLTRYQGPFIVSGLVDSQYGVCSVTCDHLELWEG